MPKATTLKATFLRLFGVASQAQVMPGRNEKSVRYAVNLIHTDGDGTRMQCFRPRLRRRFGCASATGSASRPHELQHGESAGEQREMQGCEAPEENRRCE